MKSRLKLLTFLAGLLLRLMTGSPSSFADELHETEPYDPMRLSPSWTAAAIELTVTDEEHAREVPLRIYLPSGGEAAPVILFSHGLGGSHEGGSYLGEHWSGRGFCVVLLQHPGSDVSVWKNLPLRERMAAMHHAASWKNLQHRLADVSFTVDQLEKWNAEPGHRLHGRLNIDRVGMSGHSFGAITTQYACGQSMPVIGRTYTDRRICAAIAFSPSPPRRGSASLAFRDVQIPWMLMTGTEDASPLGDTTPEQRREVYRHLPGGIDRCELVLHGAAHSAFGDRPLPWERSRWNPTHHRAILAISTAFWESYLADRPAARQWLMKGGPRSVLQDKDAWMFQAGQKS